MDRAAEELRTITLTLQAYNEILRRLETLENIIIAGRREVLRQELATVEDAYQLQRTVKQRVR